MRQLIIAATSLLIFAATSLFGTDTEGYHFTVQQRAHSLATYFDIDSDDTYPGTIKKSVFRLRENYDLSDADGWSATGIVRIASLGSWFPWAKEMDVYNTEYRWIGLIRGELVTTAAARYTLYDESGHAVGVGYLDRDMSGISIVDPDNWARRIAQFKRIYVNRISDPWKVTVYDPDAIDDRLLRIFAGLIVDIQDEFKEDT